ncbi:unnamed protein product [Sphagnum jensenii]|uniref:Uncharacterized protein n=1 Tax=Sphagnum jensenii TaxID=128206 RepID=A0ABP0WPU5_9BRYO
MSRATRHLEKLLHEFRQEAGAEAGVNYKRETPRSSRRGSTGGSTILSDSEGTTTPSTSDGARLYEAEMSRLVHQLADSRVLVATLEAQVTMLQQEKAQEESERSLYIQRLEAEVAHLENQAETDMVELMRRQNKIEEEMPALEQQLRTIKDVLHDFDVSEPLYLELRGIPEECRTARDHILLLAFEKFYKYREEIEELRRSRDSSREALTRANDEVQKLLREAQRLAAKHAYEVKDMEIDLGATKARLERLEAEATDAMVQIELLTAKGSLYDEVKEKLDKLEQQNINAENQKAVMTATLQITVQEKERLLGLIAEKDHTLDLLSMDKIYLSREVQSQTEQVKKLESEVERQHQKLREVKHARTELYQKVLTDNKDSQTANEHRLQAELSWMQVRTNLDIDSIRKEANVVADEKVRTFREMRDAALADAEGARAELRNNKSAYEELFSKYQELQRLTHAKEIEDHNSLKMTNFELDRLKVVLDKTKSSLQETRIENEALAAKAKILTKKYHDLEAKCPLKELTDELGKPMLELKEELQVTRSCLQQYESNMGVIPSSNHIPLRQGAQDTEDVPRTQAWPLIQELMGLSGLSHLNLQEQGINFATRCIELQHAVRILEKKNLELQEKAAMKEEELIKANMRTKLLHQPQSYLVDAIQSSESQLKQTLQENQELEIQLRRNEEEKRKVSCRLQALQLDIRKLLQARGSIENLQKLLKEKGIVIDDSAIKTMTASRKMPHVNVQQRKPTSTD